MRNSFPVNATLILRVLSSTEDQAASTTDTDQHELSRLLRHRLAVLEAALRRVEELRREAAKANLRLRHWITDQIIQDVPSDIAVCEFDCRKGRCTSGDWDACKNRSARPCNPSTL
jgi:hypothetical protein